MTDTARLVDGLRRTYAQHDPHQKAAVELLIAHGHWLRNTEFLTAAVVAADGDEPYIVWRKAREAFDAGEFVRVSSPRRSRSSTWRSPSARIGSGSRRWATRTRRRSTARSRSRSTSSPSRAGRYGWCRHRNDLTLSIVAGRKLADAEVELARLLREEAVKTQDQANEAGRAAGLVRQLL